VTCETCRFSCETFVSQVSQWKQGRQEVGYKPDVCVKRGEKKPVRVLRNDDDVWAGGVSGPTCALGTLGVSERRVRPRVSCSRATLCRRGSIGACDSGLWLCVLTGVCSGWARHTQRLCRKKSSFGLSFENCPFRSSCAAPAARRRWRVTEKLLMVTDERDVEVQHQSEGKGATANLANPL
jgi:hypothetical protein